MGIDIFSFYSNKARDVINNRNFFETIYLTSLVTVFLPLASDASSLNFLFNESNLPATILFFILLISVAVLVYVFGEAKYREYRWAAMKTAINELRSDILSGNSPPSTNEALIQILMEKTQFSADQILNILYEIENPNPSNNEPPAAPA